MVETLINDKAENTKLATTMVATAEERAQEQILSIIVQQDDVSWKQIIFDLIDSEQMDPWDINISILSKCFLEELKKLKEHDFRISGKVVLASAILLKLKANRLHNEEMAQLDNLIQSMEEPVDLGLDDLQLFPEMVFEEPVQEKPKLVPRTPQPRKRKVSVYDLVEALEEALETEARRPVPTETRILDEIEPPKTHIDISEVIREIYGVIYDHYETNMQPKGSLEFTHLSRSEDKRDKVMTFIPLLHLENARKVHLDQEEHFGPIAVHLLDTTPPDADALAQQFEKEQKGAV